MSYRILLLEKIHPVAKAHLSEHGFEVEEVGKALSESELAEQAAAFDAIGIRSKTHLTSTALAELKSLKAIGAFCIGTNQIDLEVSNRLGVPVFNAPYSNTRSVAELIICEMVALARQLGDRNSKAHRGEWDKSAVGAHEIRGKTLGIVGYGHIGSQVSVLAEAMGLNVIYFDVVKKLPLGNATPMDTLESLLMRSDFVSFHVPETPLTQNMMGATEINFMKQGSHLINASRGTVVDIEALVDGLKRGHLAGAAVDVFPQEPAKNSDRFQSALQELPNVILTPHIGGSTEEAQKAIGLEVAESLVKYLNQGSSFGAVNFPNLDVPPLMEGAQRLINVHKNVPGVLGQINGIVSEVGANIRSQYLATDNQIGYLVMDLESHAPTVKEQVGQLETSLRTHLIL